MIARTMIANTLIALLGVAIVSSFIVPPEAAGQVRRPRTRPQESNPVTDNSDEVLGPDVSATRVVGSGAEPAFHDRAPRRGMLIGFKVGLGRFFNNDVVHMVQPIYMTVQGREVEGEVHGHADNREIKVVKARKGYAVGAITVKTGLGIDGFSVTFMKVEKGILNPDKTMESDWAGGQGGGGETRLGATGNLAIGVAGRVNNNHELTGLGLLLAAEAMPPPEELKRSPPPAGDALTKAMKLAKDVYGEEWAAAKTPELKKALVKKLLKGADECGDDLAGKYVSLKLAKDIAVQAGDGLAAFDAIDKMAEAFTIDDVALKTAALVAFAKKPHDASEHRAIAEQALALIDQAISKDQFAALHDLEELVLPESRASRDPQFILDVKNRAEKWKSLGKTFEAMQKARLVLEKAPDDPEANLTVGRYYCFVKGDWDKGVPMLALSNDEHFKPAALQDVASPTVAADRVAVGDLWWGLAEKESPTAQKFIRARAHYWYDLALPDLSGLAKAKVEKRIKEFEELDAAPEAKPAPKVEARLKGRYRPGLVALLFRDTHFLQKATAKIDPKIDFDWGNDAPDPSLTNSFYSIRWVGYIKVSKGGNCTFFTNSCNGVRLLVDNNLLIEKNTANGTWKLQAAANLSAGYHLFEVDFMHSVGNSFCHVGWQPAGAKTASAIDANFLWHDAPMQQAAAVGQ